MKAVSIIGGGRWARTIAGVLAGLPAPDRIILHSPGNAEGVAAWIAERELGARVAAQKTLPDYAAARPMAVIVANAARDHVAAAVPALRAGIAVLVEKPMAVNAAAIRELCREAEGKAVLAGSNVFLFTRYLENFAARVAAAGPVKELRLAWQDGSDDVVRGEVKSHDPSITVFDDVLPHVLAVAGRLVPGALTLAGVDAARDGAEFLLHAKTGDVAVELKMARDAQARLRLLVVQAENGTFMLDFTREPGTIAGPGLDDVDGDPLWNSAPRPLGAMLSSFLASAEGAPLDSRLSPQQALMAAHLADAIRAWR